MTTMPSAALAILAALSGALSAAPSSASGFPVTVQTCGREVTFDAAPEAAVSYDIGMTEMVLALDLEDRLVGYAGISAFDKFNDEARARLEGLPELAPHHPSREVLIGAGTDLYIAGWNYGMRVGGEVTPETLEPFGIPVYALAESCIHVMDKPAASMDDLYTDLLNLGRIFGVEERAEALVDGYRAELAAIIEALPQDRERPKVFVYDSGEDEPFTAGSHGMPTALIEAAGGTNIMDDVRASWVAVGWEAVIDRDPDVVVIVDYGAVSAAEKIAFMKTNPAFAAIAAVRDDRFVVLSYEEVVPAPRNVEAVRTLAAAFHPG